MVEDSWEILTYPVTVTSLALIADAMEAGRKEAVLWGQQREGTGR